MTRPEESDAAETAAWAGADDETQRAAETVEAEVVDEGTAHADGPAAADDTADGPDAADATATDATATEADGAEAGDGGDDDPTSALQAQLDERTADLQRVSAEFANYRRRVERDRQSIIDTAKGSVLTELLTIVDDLDRAREHGDLEEGPLKVFADKVHALLASQGVEAFGEEGDEFDPAIHEAVQDESDGSEPVLGTILRKGYRHGERTLRTAMVIVR